MASLLESAIRDQVATAFRGKLLTGTLRRVGATSVDDHGDRVPGTATPFSFEGIRDTFNAVYAANAGIPASAIRILIIAGSLSTDPRRGDQVLIRSQWHEVIEILERDPANATHVLQCFEIEDPT
jgi:hypothetical protein